MRQWHVDPKLMCRQHLLGEHVEHHMFVGSIKKGRSVKTYIDTGLLAPKTLKSRHKELVKEMKRRGYNHKSPLPKFPKVRGWNKNKVKVKSNYKELRKRCIQCRERMER